MCRVASASLDAVAENASHRSTVGCERASAVALVGVFHASIVVATRAAVLHAGLDSECCRSECASGEGAIVHLIRSATQISPASHVGVVLKRRRERRYRAVCVAGRSLTGTPSDRVAAGKCSQITIDLLIDTRSNDAGLTFGGSEKIVGENRAVRDQTAVVEASVNGILEDGDVPSVQEVTVESVSVWVAHGEDEGLSGAVPPFVPNGVPDDLVED